MQEQLKVFIPFLLIIFIVGLFWYIFWKFVLEPNPLVRDFLDLDTKPSSEREKKV